MIIWLEAGGFSVRELAHSMEQYLVCEEQMQCDILKDKEDRYIVQARGREKFLTWNKNVWMRLSPEPDRRIRVELREHAVWKKLFVIVSLWVLFPYAIISCGILSKELLLRERVYSRLRLYSQSHL